MSNGRLIIIAGWAHSAEDLSPLCSTLSSRFDVQATSAAKLYSTVDPALQSLPPVSQYAKALYAMLSKSKGPATILAWSMGSLIAIEAITKLEAKVSRLIIVSGTARFCTKDDYPHGVPEANLRAMTGNLANRPDEVLTTFFHDSMFPETDTGKLVEKKTRKALSLTVDCLQDGLVYLRKTDMRRELPRIQAPTLVVHGKQDKIIPASAGAFLAQNIPSAHLVIHENTGHTMILDRPGLIAEDIRSFVEE